VGWAIGRPGLGSHPYSSRFPSRLGATRVFSLEIDSADFVGTFLSKNQNFCYTPSIEKSGKNACVRVLAGFGWPDDSWGVTASRSVCEKLKLKS
jgi:hypothetical protein